MYLLPKKALVRILILGRKKLKSIYVIENLEWDEQRKQKLELQSNNNELVPNIEQRITKEINLLSFKNTDCYEKSKRKKFAIQKTDCILRVDNNNDGNDNDTNDGNTTTSARSNNTTVVSGSTIGFGHNKFSIPHE